MLRAAEKLREQHGFDSGACQTLLEYCYEQRAATGVVPNDRAIVIERFKDEVGDFRVCILSPFGRRVHAPWAMALSESFRARGAELDAVWSDDGIVLRLPETEEQLTVEHFAPDPEEVEALVVQGLSKSSLFAAHFRENAGRALLLPKRDPRKRAPLWATRRRAADLLRVASQYPSFPILLETYRECLRDVFDLPALIELLSAYRRRELEFVPVESQRPSPFAATILFSYVAAYMYDGDAPLAERKAQALTLDRELLRELLGEVGVKVHVNEAEAAWVKRVTGLSDSDLSSHEAGDRVSVGEIEIGVVHTPGHTPGSQCFLVDGKLVSGDTLFLDGCGRTDLPGGDMQALERSLARLLALPDDTTIYPGHGPTATVGFVRRCNPYVPVE